MDIILERCCGVDVHKEQITVCLLITSPKGRILKKEIRQYSTFTEELERFCDWLKEYNCSDVAMESTGVYWKPIFNILEEREITVVLVNARHMKNVPGRKTDVRDCEWIAKLFRQGLLRPSLIPEANIRECRELIRRRKRLIQDRSSEINRIQKTLEDANIKLASVATDIMGASCRSMLKALLEGEREPKVLAEMAKGKLRKKISQLRKSLRGRIKDHHLFIIEQILAHIDFLNRQIEMLSMELEMRLDDYNDDLERLSTIPGVDKFSGQTILAEFGANPDAFGSSQRASSWAGLCPGNDQSAGKRRSGRNTQGNRWLREVLMECAWAASRSKDNFLRARYDRIAKRRGKKRAQFAIAHRILEIVYNILKHKTTYFELGGDYYTHLNAQGLKQHYVRGLKKLGFEVNLTPIGQAAKS